MERRRRTIATGSSTSSAISCACSSSNPGRRSTPSTRTRRSHERWLRPTCSSWTRSGATPRRFARSRWKPIGTLQRPIAWWPSSSSACVTRPEGLVKSTSQAPAAPSLAVSSAMPRTTGMLRRALAKPPGPVVSCPMHPKRGGMVSSRSRAASPPTRSCTRTKDASAIAASRSPVSVSFPGNPSRVSIRRARPPTTSRRPASMSCSTSSSTGRTPRRRPKPSTSSGV